jgi:hypothetical protein
MTRLLNGSCLCGEARYTVADEFNYALICHCSQCRRATGSAFKPFGGIERAKLEVTSGKIRIYGDVMTHDAHCKICGSLLYSIVQEGTVAHVTYGTLIDPPTLAPQAHICVGSKAPWDTICDGLPQYQELPTPSQGR